MNIHITAFLLLVGFILFLGHGFVLAVIFKQNILILLPAIEILTAAVIGLFYAVAALILED